MSCMGHSSIMMMVVWVMARCPTVTAPLPAGHEGRLRHHCFPSNFAAKKKKKKLFLYKNMGRKPWSPSCRIFLGRAGDRTEVSLCVGLVGLGGCHSEFSSSAKGMGERKSFVLFVCAENVCEMYLFLFLFTNFSFCLSCLCRSQVLRGSRRGRRPHPVHLLLDIRTH